MSLVKYNRTNAVFYAKNFALKRNPNFYDFSYLGGDCTNFVSQCIYFGFNKMDYPNWYYYSLKQRSPSWSGVTELYNYLIQNKAYGVVTKEVLITDVEIGDIVQLKFKGINDFSHTSIISEIKGAKNFNNILICSHSNDSLNRPLSTYFFEKIRYIHISHYTIFNK